MTATSKQEAQALADRCIDKLTGLFVTSFVTDMKCEDNARAEEILQDEELLPFFTSAMAFGATRGFIAAAQDFVDPTLALLLEIVCDIKAQAEFESLISDYDDDAEIQHKMAVLGITKETIQRERARRKDETAKQNPDLSNIPGVENRPGGPADWLKDGYARV